MEELFQLIVALFIVSFPILNLFARRRQSRRARKQRERAAREAEAGGAGEGEPGRRDRRSEGARGDEPGRREPEREGRAGRRRRRRAAGVTDVDTSEPRRKGRFARWAEQLEARARQAAGEREEWPSARQSKAEAGGGPGSGGAASRGRLAGQPADVTRQYEIGRGTAPAERSAAGEPAGAEGRERIAGLPQLQQAVVWSEILGRPKALRRSPDPWDDDAGP